MISDTRGPFTLVLGSTIMAFACGPQPGPGPSPEQLPCAPNTRCLRVDADGEPTPQGDHLAQCTGVFPDYIVPEASFPPGYAGPWFALADAFPESAPPAEDLPWTEIDFKAGKDQADAYLYALRDYSFEGMIEADFDPQNNPLRSWYHVPLMNYRNGRELVHGLTRERDLLGPELGLKDGVLVRNYAVGLYNDIGAFTVGQVLKNPTEPDFSKAPFEEGAMVFKILFTEATREDFEDEDNYLAEGSPEWQIAIGDTGPDGAPVLTPVRLLQMDVAVRDARAEPGGWVFGTFAFDKDAPDEVAWNRMRPVGLMWGNDPGYTPEDMPTPLEESIVSDEIPTYAAEHLGWAGRVNGPVDNPVSACLSCHQVAQYPAAADIGPFRASCDTNDKKLYWFRNLAAGEAFGPMNKQSCEPGGDDEPVSLDFSLQVAVAVRAAIHNVNPCLPESELNRLGARPPLGDQSEIQR